MQLRKSFKYQLKTNSNLSHNLSMMAGCMRLIWNKTLAMNLDRLSSKQPIIWYLESSKWLTLWKRSAEYAFLNNCPSQSLQHKLKDLEKAFRDGFDKKQPLKRLPKFQKKGDKASFRYPAGVRVAGNQVFLPKLGWVKFRKSRELAGKLCQTTIIQEAGQWYISFSCEITIADPVHSSTCQIGLDMGIKSFATSSNGTFYQGVSAFRKYEQQLAKAQRALSRKKKRSNNRLKAQQRVAKLHRKIAHIRLDYLHQLSTTLSKNHAVLYLEDLKVRNMSQSAKGTLTNPGKQVKAKSGLNKSILDQGWGMFKNQLIYKSKWQGGKVYTIPPAYTSQTCHACGYKSDKNRLSQSQFHCQQCRHQDHADVNAAKNILRAGQALSACGDIKPAA